MHIFYTWGSYTISRTSVWRKRAHKGRSLEKYSFPVLSRHWLCCYVYICYFRLRSHQRYIQITNKEKRVIQWATSVYINKFFLCLLLQSTPSFCYSPIALCKHNSIGTNILYILVQAMFATILILCKNVCYSPFKKSKHYLKEIVKTE